MTQTDPKDLIDQADDLLNNINQANLKFVNKTNQITDDINKSFKVVDKLNQELEKEESDAIEKIDGQVLEYLGKQEE